MIRSIMLIGVMLIQVTAFAQGGQGQRGQGPGQQPQTQAPATPTATPAPPPPAAPPEKEEAPIITKHEVKIGDKTLKYTVTTGLMPIKNQTTGETEAKIFYMAYTMDNPGDTTKRPLMFSFNGGPGSASVWLHLGALGPRRVKMTDDGFMPAPPYQLVNNESTWLDETDLVFIDPVGTGFSRATKPEYAAKFTGLNGDLDSVGEFIRMYLTRSERWTSPLFLVGESYGTTRASGLAGLLVERGIAFNGVILVSTIMNFQTARFAPGNDTAYALIFPSYTATAWYHKKLPANLQGKSLREALDESEKFAEGEYLTALTKGDQLAGNEKQQILDRMSALTGLSKNFIDNANLRVSLSLFNKELLRDRKRTTGRLDSRFTGIDPDSAGSSPDFDPSMTAIRPPYTAAFNQYVRSELGYKTDAPYFILGGGFTTPWNWSSDNQYVDTSVALKSAFAKNPYMKVFNAYGYYDMATPYFAAEYTIDHMNLDPSLKANIKHAYYEAGHMMYIDVKSLIKLKKDIASFIKDSVK